MTTFCQKFYSAMRSPGDELNETTLFMLLPVRANMDAFTAKFVKFSQPSGYALKHAKAVDLHIKSGEVERDKDKTVISKEINWKIAKGKLGISEGAEGMYRFVMGKGIDMTDGLVNTAKVLELICRHGTYYTILDYEDRIAGGLDGVKEVVRNSPSLLQELREAVSAKLQEGQHG